ncbi:hypothetical protein D1007_12296 [Hordeum vulgare]|nr:hypothetical protein D1007_12296 [Hordeum vulgare]
MSIEPSEIPTTIEDPKNARVDDDLMVMCEHGKPTKKLVAFEGISTVRRFLACSLDWSSLLLSVHLYSHQKDVENTTISVDSSMGNMNEQIVAKDGEITTLKADVDQLKFNHVAQGNCITNMKHNHLK